MTKPGPDSIKAEFKLVALIVVIACAGLLYWQFGDRLSLESLAQREAALRQFRWDHPVLIYGLAFLVYVAVTGLSLPGATGLTLLYGWFFNLLPCIALVSFASTTGATCAFWLSRYLLRDSVQARFGDRLTSFNRALETEGAFYLFTLRLIPAVPFFVINLVMGLTPIRTFTFWIVSQLGMFPATVVYCYAGSSVPNLQTLAEYGVRAALSPAQLVQLFCAFALLGIFPLAMKRILGVLRQSKP